MLNKKTPAATCVGNPCFYNTKVDILNKFCTNIGRLCTLARLTSHSGACLRACQQVLGVTGFPQGLVCSEWCVGGMLACACFPNITPYIMLVLEFSVGLPLVSGLACGPCTIQPCHVFSLSSHSMIAHLAQCCTAVALAVVTFAAQNVAVLVSKYSASFTAHQVGQRSLDR